MTPYMVKSLQEKLALVALCVALLFPHDLIAAVSSESPQSSVGDLTDSISTSLTDAKDGGAQDVSSPTPDGATQTPEGADNLPKVTGDSVVYLDAELLVKRPVEDPDTAMTVVEDENLPYGLDGKIPFNPDPTRAVWLSALFPGLGQIYNRRYWKLPIIVGGFMGIAYGTSWNNKQYNEYSQAYRDLLDNDPSTNSYMDFFPPTTSESSLDKKWLTNVMKSRKDYYRRNRDLCIICIVALYGLCMIDAYVDASLAHFDLSPDLSMDVAPSVMLSPGNGKSCLSYGLNWAFTF